MSLSLKSLLETRLIYDRRDETIRGQMSCSFLALALRKGLQDRLSARGKVVEWADVIRDLEQKRCNISDVAFAYAKLSIVLGQSWAHAARRILMSASSPAASSSRSTRSIVTF